MADESDPNPMNTTTPAAPAAPDDVAAAPDDAEKTASGLPSKVLQKGTGENRPTATDKVEVHYSGWTTDGKLFDSSVQRGQPTSFQLNQVIPGWTEGLQLMVEGEKRRFWIPADLAYGENPQGGAPGGTLVFDVELLGIKQAPKLPEGLEKSAAGVPFEDLEKGSGDAHPSDGDLVVFHALVKTMEDEVVQDTHGAPEAPSAPMARLNPPMQEAFKAMLPNGKRRIWLAEPSAPGGHLVMELELISFKNAPEPPKAPEDVAAAPEGAEKSESGLAWKILAEAPKDAAKPKETDTVKVHYTGWTTDGERFDSSIERDQPATFPVGQVIPGWTEGLQLMGVGEKRRFWIPANLAYGDEAPGNAPSGMLVFDVELLEIVE